jgi:predicted N-formylglutamate amidohydrolase
MIQPWEDISGDVGTSLLLIGDHASDRVPAGIDLGVPPTVMREHVAIDIGVAPLGRALCAALRCPGVLGNVSRLVIDLNREEDAPGLIVTASDGHTIAGNLDLDAGARAGRVDLYWRPYHARLKQVIAEYRPKLLISLHSFTPELRGGGPPRPWQIGVLYNQDDRAARIAIALLEAAGVVTGDNQPYSGQMLNATMNRHGEGNAIAYLGLEVRQGRLANRRVSPIGVISLRRLSRRQQFHCLEIDRGVTNILGGRRLTIREDHEPFRQVAPAQPPCFGRPGEGAAPLLLLCDGAHRGGDRTPVRRGGQRRQR